MMHSITSHAFDIQVHCNLCNLSCFGLKGFGSTDVNDDTVATFPNVLKF